MDRMDLQDPEGLPVPLGQPEKEEKWEPLGFLVQVDHGVHLDLPVPQDQQERMDLQGLQDHWDLAVIGESEVQKVQKDL